MSEVSAFGVIHKGISGNLKVAAKAKLAGNPRWGDDLNGAEFSAVTRHVYGKQAAKNIRRGLKSRARSDIKAGKQTKSFQRDINDFNDEFNRINSRPKLP